MIDRITTISGATYRVEERPPVLAFDHLEDGTYRPRYHPQAPRVLVQAGQKWHVVTDYHIRQLVLASVAPVEPVEPETPAQVVQPAPEPAKRGRKADGWRQKFEAWLEAELEAGRVVPAIEPLGQEGWRVAMTKRQVFEALKPRGAGFRTFETRTRPSAFTFRGFPILWGQ
jgi:hypothetical protein